MSLPQIGKNEAAEALEIRKRRLLDKEDYATTSAAYKREPDFGAETTVSVEENPRRSMQS